MIILVRWWDGEEPEGSLDGAKARLGRLRPGEQFAYTFDLGDNWQHLCTVAPQRADPLETLGIIPVEPLPCWGWGDIPDQYGRRWDGDDGSSPMPKAPNGLADRMPPTCWDTSWEDFIADTCHGMFGFEKPRWHYIPEFGALVDALAKAAQTLPEARSRFLSGDLPPGGRLRVRYDAADADELRWAKVESWEDAGHAVIRDTGRELAPGVGPGPLVAIETRFIADWASGWTAAASSRAPAPKAPATSRVAHPCRDARPRWSATQELTRGVGF